MESFQSKVFKVLLRLTGRKRFWERTGKDFQKGIAKMRSANTDPPKRLRRTLNIDKRGMNGHYYYELRPIKGSGKKHVFYLHGGGYVNPITIYHWNFLGRLANELNSTITVPLYPLAPEYTYEHTFNFIYPLYMEQAKRVEDPADMVLMGDSAGGGLALSLALYLKDKEVSQPGEIILNAPFLDITLTNPEIDAIDKYDPMISKFGAREAGKMYAGDADPTLHLLSPMYGELKGLGEMTLIIGTHDILVADARKFKKKAEEQGVPIHYYEYPKMVHVFPLFNYPESKRAMKQIVHNIIK
ncbi:MAG TPA: alpha/beta hydrolase [Virgibacillus sp.]|nr:alpha/beta hydrolase [Virgibacillus sp.]